MSIATQTGDDGSTSLLFGKRVPKTDPRIACNGAMDELNAALGLARAHLRACHCEHGETISRAILSVQEELFVLMGDVAAVTGDAHRASLKKATPEMTAALTQQIRDLETARKGGFQWAIPGSSVPEAALEVARTVCRRAERCAVALQESDPDLNPEILRYLNRLSDLIWLWARQIESA